MHVLILVFLPFWLFFGEPAAADVADEIGAVVPSVIFDDKF